MSCGLSEMNIRRQIKTLRELLCFNKIKYLSHSSILYIPAKWYLWFYLLKHFTEASVLSDFPLHLL